MITPLNDEWSESLVFVVVEQWRYFDWEHSSWQLGEVNVFTSEQDAIEFAKSKKKNDYTYTVFQVIKNDKTVNSAELYET